MILSNIKILSVSETMSGTSATTGKSWATKNILLGFEDETGESFIRTQVDEDVWQSYGLQAGSIATVNLKFRTGKFRSGFVYNDIRIVPLPKE